MEKYIDSETSPEVAHIISMQTLLSEYDRENKQLSRQILELMEENKSLKMDKIKTNMIFKCSASRKDKKDKENMKREILLRNCSNNIVSHFKLQEQDCKIKEGNLQQQTSNQKQPDNASQTNLKLENINNIRKSHQAGQKQIQAFSFGADTGREKFNETEIKIELNNIMVTPKKRVTKDTAIFITPPCPTNLTHEHNATRESRRHQNNQTQRSGNKTSQLIPLQIGNTRRSEEQGRQGLKKIRSCHSINPSPQLTPSASGKQIGTPVRRQYEAKTNKTSSIKRSIMNISYQGVESFIRLESMEKKKKFIDIVSHKRTPIRLKTDHY